jgi:molybdate transport system ATP-binding protein
MRLQEEVSQLTERKPRMNGLHFDCRHQYSGGFLLGARFQAGDGVTGLFGASGSGKSTVFALIAGILRPQVGTIRLADRVLLDTTAGICLPPEQRRIGVVFQDHLLFPHLSVRQNLLFGKREKLDQAMDLDRVVAVLELGGLLERRPGTLSGGQRQRVALGRALLRGPELLLMDEPLTGLDEGLKERILTYLERVLAEWRLPTVFVSHDQADVRRLAEQVVVLEKGRVIDAGPTAATLDRAVLARLDHGPGPINLLRAQALRQVSEHWEGQVGEQTLQLPSGVAFTTGGNALLRVLPRDVVLSHEPVGGLSARNQLRGQVREVVPIGGRVFVAVDVGQFLWAEVTPEATQELGLEAGNSVTCMIKTAAFEPLG